MPAPLRQDMHRAGGTGRVARPGGMASTARRGSADAGEAAYLEEVGRRSEERTWAGLPRRPFADGSRRHG